MACPKFLAYLVILCFERLCPKQNYCCSPEVTRFAPQKVWTGYATVTQGWRWAGMMPIPLVIRPQSNSLSMLSPRPKKRYPSIVSHVPSSSCITSSKKRSVLWISPTFETCCSARLDVFAVGILSLMQVCLTNLVSCNSSAGPRIDMTGHCFLGPTNPSYHKWLDNLEHQTPQCRCIT